MDQIGFGVLGAGENSKARRDIMPAIVKCPNADLVAVCSRQSSTAEEAIAELQHQFDNLAHIEPYTDFEYMLANPRIQAVYICTPNSLHSQQTLLALEAGKHVLVEKPLATNYADASWTVAEAQEKGLVLATNTWWPYSLVNNPILSSQAYKSIEIQEVIFAHLKNYPLTGWRTDKKMAGGGIWLDLGVHAVSWLMYLLGDEDATIEVRSWEAGYRQGFEIEDAVKATVEFGKVKATICLSYNWPEKQCRTEFKGKDGRYIRVVQDKWPWYVLVNCGDGEILNHPDEQNTFVDLLEDFCTAIETSKAPKINTARLALEAQKVIEQGYKLLLEQMIA